MRERKNDNISVESWKRGKGLCLFHEFPRHRGGLGKDVLQCRVFKFLQHEGTISNCQEVLYYLTTFYCPIVHASVFINHSFPAVWSGQTPGVFSDSFLNKKLCGLREVLHVSKWKVLCKASLDAQPQSHNQTTWENSVVCRVYDNRLCPFGPNLHPLQVVKNGKQSANNNEQICFASVPASPNVNSWINVILCQTDQMAWILSIWTLKYSKPGSCPWIKEGNSSRKHTSPGISMENTTGLLSSLEKREERTLHFLSISLQSLASRLTTGKWLIQQPVGSWGGEGGHLLGAQSPVLNPKAWNGAQSSTSQLSPAAS